MPDYVQGLESGPLKLCGGDYDFFFFFPLEIGL